MSLWSQHLLATEPPELPLPEKLEQLFSQQRAAWDLFRNGEASLAEITTKRYTKNNSDIIVQANPGRAISTNAKVDPTSIAKRPCFLCPTSLPPQERGIEFGAYVILPNPFPILKHHVTIALKEHLPQACAPRIEDLIHLTTAFGDDMFLLYNGPRCGASAPDHMHFQACDAAPIPLFRHFPDMAGDNRFTARTLWGRHMLLGLFDHGTTAENALRKVLYSFSEITGEKEEPLCNIITRIHHKRLHVAFFPRAKHRSSCYFSPPDERLSISPAAVEMAGTVVVADVAHFERVDEHRITQMYQEITLDDTLFSRLAENSI